MSGSFSDLEHDHLTVFRMMLEIERIMGDLRAGRATLVVVSDELLEALTSLEGDVLGHFAREEAALFLELRKTLPELALSVDALESGHDRISGLTARLVHALHSSVADFTQVEIMFDRLRREYEQHVVDEKNLLDVVRKKLPTEERVRLAKLMEGL